MKQNEEIKKKVEELNDEDLNGVAGGTYVQFTPSVSGGVEGGVADKSKLPGAAKGGVVSTPVIGTPGGPGTNPGRGTQKF